MVMIIVCGVVIGWVVVSIVVVVELFCCVVVVIVVGVLICVDVDMVVINEFDISSMEVMRCMVNF